MPVEKLKYEKCKVLRYDNNTHELDIDFKGYGIRLSNVDDIKTDFVTIKYRGDIGSTDFEYKL